MKLTFSKQHLSISAFNPVDLADLTVLTGVNGAGKTHLMQAIENGSVQVQGIDKNRIVHFNYETFRLANEPAFNAQQISKEREQAWDFFQKQVLPQAAKWGNNLASTGDEEDGEAIPIWERDDPQCQSYRGQIEGFVRQPRMRRNHQALGIYNLAKRLPGPLHEVTHDEFVLRYVPFQLHNDFLPMQLGRVFWDYHVKQYHNVIQNYRNESEGLDLPALREDEFIAEHGRKPWDVVNEILASFDSMCYRVNSPEGLQPFGQYQLKLQHTDNPSLEVQFDSLSSGERILMAMVASVYKSSLDGLFPDLLLLDEVDASLHPSMMNNLLSVIAETFLQHGTKVILVTHSPTTIALAPEEAVFVMNRIGSKRIEKRGNGEALSVLTEGFATIDQGIKLFDEVARTPITLVTEGHNASLVRRALDLHEVEGVEVLDGVESITGEKQLKTLFEFLARVPHQNKVIFVWDCDVKNVPTEANQTYPYVLPQNLTNSLVKRGIENAFPETALADYLITITKPDGSVRQEFDASCKSEVATKLCKHGTKDDFGHFKLLAAEVNRIKALPVVVEASST